MKTETIKLRVSPEDKEELKFLAQGLGLSMSQLLVFGGLKEGRDALRRLNGATLSYTGRACKARDWD